MCNVFHCAKHSASAKRQSHNVTEKKRKDKLKLDIDDIRKLLPELVFESKKQVCILYYKHIMLCIN